MTNTTTAQTNEQRPEQSAFLDFANRPSATRIFTGTNPETGEKDFDYDYRGYRIEKGTYCDDGGYFIRRFNHGNAIDCKASHWTYTVRDAKSIIDTLVSISGGQKVTEGRKQSVQLRAEIAADLAVA